MEAAEGRDVRGKPSSRHEQFGEMLYLMLMASGCPKFLALVDRFGVVTSGRRDATVQGGQRMARGDMPVVPLDPCQRPCGQCSWAPPPSA